MAISTQQKNYRSLGIITIAVASLSTTHAADAAGIYLTPRIVGYFDNFMSLDSSINANTDPAESQIDALNDVLTSILGPAANLSIASSNITIKSEQAAYTLAGASLEFVWDNDRGHQDRWIVTALTGDADVRTDLLTQTVADFSFGSLQSRDLWTSEETSHANLDRLDIELSFERGLTGSLAFIGGARYERVEFEYRGRQTTLISQNLANVVNSAIGDPILFDLGAINGATRGTVRPRMYSGRLGLAARTGHDQERLHDLFASAQLHLTYTPAATSTASLTPDDPSLPVTTLRMETDEHWPAGPDVIVGYEFRAGERVRIGLRYRCTVYFDMSGHLQQSDPRLNHGVNFGITYQLR